MAIFHGTSWNVDRTDPTVRAACYPQIIALTRLLASPYWRAQADRPEPIEFIAEVRRTVAPNYVWALANPHRHYDPLVQTLGHHLRPVGGLAELFDAASPNLVRPSWQPRSRRVE